MKKLIFLLFVTSLLATSCKTMQHPGNGNLPPGQVKKATGRQSAREYAPGQQKKKKNKTGMETASLSIQPDGSGLFL